MLTLRINQYSTEETEEEVPVGGDYLRKDWILKRQLEKCKLKLGDTITFTTNKGKKEGIVFELVDNPANCRWRSDTQPFFIGVRCPLVSVIDGSELTYGSEIAYVPWRRVRSINA